MALLIVGLGRVQITQRITTVLPKKNLCAFFHEDDKLRNRFVAHLPLHEENCVFSSLVLLGAFESSLTQSVFICHGHHFSFVSPPIFTIATMLARSMLRDELTILTDECYRTASSYDSKTPESPLHVFFFAGVLLSIFRASLMLTRSGFRINIFLIALKASERCL